MNYTFKIESEAQFLAAKAYFLALGYKNELDGYNYINLVSNKFLNFVIDNNKHRIFACAEACLSEEQKIEFANIFTLKIEKVIKIELNNQYSAEVSIYGIKVGCQTFSLDIIDKLVEARGQLKG